jgi:hypothetical protein
MTTHESETKVLIVVLFNNEVLISRVKMVQDGSPNKTEIVLTNPFVVKGKSLSPYLSEYTNQRQFYLQPAKVITLATPNTELQEKYESLNAE